MQMRCRVNEEIFKNFKFTKNVKNNFFSAIKAKLARDPFATTTHAT